MNNNEETIKVGIEAHKMLTAALEKIECEKSFPPSGKHIKIWDVKNGEQAEEFGFSELNDGFVLLFIDKSQGPSKHFHTEFIEEEYFHSLLDLWPSYLNGKVPVAKIKPTKNAKYLVSIMHYLFEINQEFAACLEKE